MTASSPLPAPQLLPLARYRDLGAALEWLNRAFGFEKQVAVSDADGQVIYAQVTYGTSMMMLGAVRDTDLDALMRQPDEVGGVETQSCYVVVVDADEHFRRAVEAGAEVVLPLKSDGLGRRGYSCRDPEGHLWSFGTYSPARGAAPAELEPEPMPAPRPRRAAMLIGLLIAGTFGWGLHAAVMQDGVLSLARMDEAERAYTELSKVRAEQRAVHAALEKTRSELDTERKARLIAEAAAAAARQEASAATEAKVGLERARDDLKEELERERSIRQSAEAASREAKEKLATEREARVALEHETAAVKQAEVDKRIAAASAKASEGTERPAAIEPANKMETSATTAALPSKPDEKVALAAKKAAAVRSKRPAARKSPVPTYVIELSHVPWPYNAWYGQ